MEPKRRTASALIAGAGLVIALASVVAPGWSQLAADPTPEQQKTLQRLALAKAHTSLMERLRALDIGRGVTVADWLARADAEEQAGLGRALHLWVRTLPRYGAPRLYSDSVCEVDIRVDPSAVSERLLELLSEDGAASQHGVYAASIKAAARQWPVFWETGRAAWQPTRQTGRPLGWEDVTREGVERARGAAAVDAHGALLEEVRRLKIGETRRLREFMDSNSAVRAALETELQRATEIRVRFEPDQVAVAEARLGMRELLRLLIRVHQAHYAGEDFAAADFRELALRAGRRNLVATGLASPPAHTRLRSRYAPIEYDVPPWAATALTAVGRYVPAEGESPDQATQREAARLDGIARLGTQVAQLVIRDDLTVAQYVGYHQDLKGDVVLLLSAARPASPPRELPDGGIELQVELPLRRLWEILKSKMTLEEVEPPEDTDGAEPPPASNAKEEPS